MSSKSLRVENTGKLRRAFKRYARPLTLLAAAFAVNSIPGDHKLPPTLFDRLALKTCPDHAAPQTKAIVVFTGGAGRVSAAMRLYEQQRNPHTYLYISGINSDVTIHDVLKANHHANLNSEIGRHIFYDNAKTTNANAIQSAMFLKDRCISDVELVTSDYHLMRAQFLLKQALWHINHHPHVSYHYVDAKPLSAWQQTEEDFKRKAIKFVHSLGIN